jgi:hypothetical protein
MTTSSLFDFLICVYLCPSVADCFGEVFVMSSTLRIAANRANGAKSRGPVTPDGKRVSAANAVHSTGPVTPEGKARVSQNAVKHGILARSVVLPGECPRGFEKSHAALRDELRPRTYIDNELVEIMAAAHWRRKRAWCIERDQLSHAVEARQSEGNTQGKSENDDSPSMQTALAFHALCDGPGNLKSIRRYEVTWSREFLRHLNLYESRRRNDAGQTRFTKQTEPKTG